MIVEREYYVKLSEIGKENKITNKALLGILEDIGGVHSILLDMEFQQWIKHI